MPGMGVFLPSETAYKDPNRFRDVLEAEGTKQARYLSSMDQFYAQMEESKRQFDVTSGQRERFFEEEMAFKGEELEAETELQMWLKGRDVELGRLEIGAQERLGEQELGLGYEKLGFEREKREQDVGVSEFVKGLYEGQEERKEYQTYGPGGKLSAPSTPSKLKPSSGEDYLGPIEWWNF